MIAQRHPYVPYVSMEPGGVELSMQDKKYIAQKQGNHWDVLSWENKVVVCDRLTPEPGEDIQVYLIEHYG